MLLVFQNKDNIETIGFWSMHSGFALDLSDKRFVKCRFGRSKIYTHLDLFVSNTSWRRLQDMSSRRFQDMSSRRFQDMSSRRLQDVFSVTVLKTSKYLLGTYCKFHFSKSKILMNFAGIIIMFNCNYFHIKMSPKRQLKL